MERYRHENKRINPFKAKVNRMVGNDLEAIIALGMVGAAAVAAAGTVAIAARKTYKVLSSESERK